MGKSYQRWFVVFLIGFLLVVSALYFRQARGLVGSDIPGVLTYSNGIVGVYNQNSWPGMAAGVKLHDWIIEWKSPTTAQVRYSDVTREVTVPIKTFVWSDFFAVFFIPYLSGLLFLAFAGLVYYLLQPHEGAMPFFLFLSSIAAYFMASFNFHAGHHAPLLFLLNFAFMPAHMTSFALVFPERGRGKIYFPYLLSFLLSIPYVITYYHNPLIWPFWEKVIIVYAALSYFFWLYRLTRILRKPQQESNRLIARALLVGQGVSFVVPLSAVIVIFVFGKNIPLNWIVPVNLLFPIAAVIGLLLGKLERTQRELVQREKMAGLGQMLSGVAHEINNPLNFIHNNLEPLKEYIAYLKKTVPPDAAKYRENMSASEVIADLETLFSNMEEGTKRLSSIIGDLRHFGHSQDGKIENVPLQASLSSVLNILKSRWEARIIVYVDVPESLNVRGNPGQLSQVWMNLLSNAIDAIQDKGEIRVTAEKKGMEAFITVQDSGEGIAPEKLHRIFDPFYTTKEQGKGTGLGLSIVHDLVKKWGGTISAQSRPGEGTRFCLILPSP